MSILCMKTRTCLLFVTCVVGSICVSFLWLMDENETFVDGRPKRAPWNVFVSQTHQHIRDLQDNYYLNYLSEADPYLRVLGFEPKEYSTSELNDHSPNAVSSNSLSRPINLISDSSVSQVQTFLNLSNVTPVIAVPVQSGQTTSAWDLYNSALLHLASDSSIVYFYDLGLGYYERLDLINRCKNFSIIGMKKTIYCELRRLDWSSYPAHVSQHKLEAYRPLIIADALNSSGAVLYLSPFQRFRDRISPSILDKARHLGIVGWRLDGDSTSAVTHPKSFIFFQTDSQNFYFHHSIRGDRLLVYNTESVRRNLLFPWLRCSLTLRCISPVGAQDTGCRLYRKPLYLYSGCHRYDVSIMNVVIGLMFSFDSTPYTIDVDEGRFVSSQSDLIS